VNSLSRILEADFGAGERAEASASELFAIGTRAPALGHAAVSAIRSPTDLHQIWSPTRSSLFGALALDRQFQSIIL
jgi:hypothetical protein